MNDYYSILGVSKNASSYQITQAYQRLIDDPNISGDKRQLVIDAYTPYQIQLNAVIMIQSMITWKAMIKTLRLIKVKNVFIKMLLNKLALNQLKSGN